VQPNENEDEEYDNEQEELLSATIRPDQIVDSCEEEPDNK